MKRRSIGFSLSLSSSLADRRFKSLKNNCLRTKYSISGHNFLGFFLDSRAELRKSQKEYGSALRAGAGWLDEYPQSREWTAEERN